MKIRPQVKELARKEKITGEVWIKTEAGKIGMRSTSLSVVYAVPGKEPFSDPIEGDYRGGGLNMRRIERMSSFLKMYTVFVFDDTVEADPEVFKDFLDWLCLLVNSSEQLRVEKELLLDQARERTYMSISDWASEKGDKAKEEWAKANFAVQTLNKDIETAAEIMKQIKAVDEGLYRAIKMA